MKVLFQEHSVLHYTIGLTQALAKLGVQIDLLTGKRLKIKGVNLHYIGPSLFSGRLKPTRLKLWHYLRLLPSAEKYDLIHTNGAANAEFALDVRRRYRIPIVHTVHGSRPIIHVCSDAPMVNGLFKELGSRYITEVKWIRKLTNEGAKIVTISEYMGRLLKKYLGIDSSIIYHGCDLKRFNPDIDGEPVRKSLEIRDEKLVLWIARMYPTKDPLVFIQAIPYVLKSYRKVKFLMKGRGPLYSYAIRTAERLGVLDKYLKITDIHIPERQLGQYYAAADIFVVTSKYEGFGMTCVEAMACGKPVIATDDGALPEVVGDCGLLFERSNSRDLAEKIITLLENEDLAHKLGEKASQRVSRYFTWEQAAKKYYQVYSSIS